MSKIKTVLAIGAAALLLASCGRPDQPAETEAPSVSAEVEVAPESEPDNTEALADAHGSYHSGGYQSEPEDDEISDAEINRLALEIIWDSQSALDQEDLCWGWNYDQAMMVDAFLEGAGDSYSRSEVKSFFNGKC